MNPDLHAIARAVSILREGGLVAFPTETVYGLGADATNPAALARLFRVKGRPAHHPLIVHLGDPAWLDAWACDVPTAARDLAVRFWPGPLTMILRRAAQVPDEVTGGQDTVGLRVPAHPVARVLLGAFRGGIAAPSANRFGRVSPTTADHVRADLGDDVDLVLDGGASSVGIESTIVDLSTGTPVLLRPGAITAAAIESVTGLALGPPTADAPRAPGTLEGHYAPRTPLELVDGRELVRRIRADRDVAVLAFDAPPDDAGVQAWHVAPRDAGRYAHDLYATIRDLDRAGAAAIVVERPPLGPDWAGVADRLRRAAHRP